ncbi:MAG: hypothetical protein J2P50_17205 [Hyphomicrobiaceae bacterium]|nr:hypothetical protein [Hyphomicrobiaceae bacterium]
MKTLLSILALAGVFTLSSAAAERWAGATSVQAQAASSACFQNCANVRRWPAAQCEAYCRGKTKRR